MHIYTYIHIYISMPPKKSKRAPTARLNIINKSEWDAREEEWPAGPSSPAGSQQVISIYRRHGDGEWEPWVVVAQSALLRRIKGAPPGLGLYCNKRGGFKSGDVIGVYAGTIVGNKRFANSTEALNSRVCRNLVNSGKDMILVRNVHHTKGGGVELIDGSTGKGPRLQHMNDARGTRKKNNIVMKQSGACVADKDIKQRFKFNKNITDNIDSELRFDYGEEYWHLMERLGKSADFPIEL